MGRLPAYAVDRHHDYLSLSIGAARQQGGSLGIWIRSNCSDPLQTLQALRRYPQHQLIRRQRIRAKSLRNHLSRVGNLPDLMTLKMEISGGFDL